MRARHPARSRPAGGAARGSAPAVRRAIVFAQARPAARPDAASLQHRVCFVRTRPLHAPMPILATAVGLTLAAGAARGQETIALDEVVVEGDAPDAVEGGRHDRADRPDPGLSRRPGGEQHQDRHAPARRAAGRHGRPARGHHRSRGDPGRAGRRLHAGHRAAEQFRRPLAPRLCRARRRHGGDLQERISPRPRVPAAAGHPERRADRGAERPGGGLFGRSDRAASSTSSPSSHGRRFVEMGGQWGSFEQVPRHDRFRRQPQPGRHGSLPLQPRRRAPEQLSRFRRRRPAPRRPGGELAGHARHQGDGRDRVPEEPRGVRPRPRRRQRALGFLPISRFLGEPGQRIDQSSDTLQVRVDHRFDADWQMRLSTYLNSNSFVGEAVEVRGLSPDNRTALRDRNFRNYRAAVALGQAELVGRFDTAGIGHTCCWASSARAPTAPTSRSARTCARIPIPSTSMPRSTAVRSRPTPGRPTASSSSPTPRSTPGPDCSGPAMEGAGRRAVRLLRAIVPGAHHRRPQRPDHLRGLAPGRPRLPAAAGTLPLRQCRRSFRPNSGPTPSRRRRAGRSRPRPASATRSAPSSISSAAPCP